jgi:hypothetical protein
MHASIWRFRGDPDELLRAYESMLAEIPDSNMRLPSGSRTSPCTQPSSTDNG